MPSKFPWSKSHRPPTSEGTSNEGLHAQSSAPHEPLPSPQYSPRHLDTYFRKFDRGHVDESGQTASSNIDSDANLKEKIGRPLSGSVGGPQLLHSEGHNILGDAREPKKTGLRSRLGLGNSAKDTGHLDTSKLYSKGLGRSASIKRKDNISLLSANSLSTDQISLPNQISSGHSSAQLSPGLPEQEKVGLDPFLVQSDQPRQSISLGSSSSHQSSSHQQPEQLHSITNQHSYNPSRNQDLQGKSSYLNPSDRLVRQSQQNPYEPYNHRDAQQSVRQYNCQTYNSPNPPDHQSLNSASTANPSDISSSQPQSSPYLSQYRQYQVQDYNARAQDSSTAREDESFYDPHKRPPQYQRRDDQSPQQPKRTNQLLEPRNQQPQARPQSQSRNTPFPAERTSSKQQPPSYVVQERRSQAETGSSDSIRLGTTPGRASEDPYTGQRSQPVMSSLQSPPLSNVGHVGTGGSSSHNGGPYNRSASKLSHHDENSERQTPSQLPTATDLTEEEIMQIVKKSNDFKTLREKYDRVKRLYFEKDAQVQKLQNTIASSRLSLSRTSLDDNEYSARFSRLDGLIAQLAFSIRKSWKSIPNWMQTVVNKDAINTGKQEMTAVGRAFISSWLVDEVFDKYFHPDLDPGLSSQLKTVHRNLRRAAPVSQSSEEDDVLNSKIVSWRLATLDGLQDELRSSQGNICRRSLIDQLHEKLLDAIKLCLSEPAPLDLDGGVNMIIDLAINSICIHLPCESREVQIEYFRPGLPLHQELMKVESGGIPALSNPSVEDWDRTSTVSTSTGHDSEARDSISEADTPASAPNARDNDGKPRRNMLSSLMGSKKFQATGHSANKQVLESEEPQAQSAQPLLSRKDNSVPRVRLAVSLAVKVEGRSVLLRSSVFGT